MTDRIAMDQGDLESILDALRNGGKGRRDGDACAARLARTIAADGAAFAYQVSDFLFWTAPDTFELSNWPLEKLARYFDLNKQTFYLKPKGRSATGFEGLAASDVVRLATALERIGFDIDPTPLVAQVMPKLRKQRRLTQAELYALWYPHGRSRMVPMHLVRSDIKRLDVADRCESFKTGTGYLIEAFHDSAGLAWIMSTPPKWHRQSAAARNNNIAGHNGPYCVRAA